MQKIVFYTASLRSASFNRQMAALARRCLEGKAEVTYAAWEDVPPFNQDCEWPAPHSIERLRQQFVEADGIWFFTPEYNAGIPGTLKNVLDWLSRPLEKGGFWQDTALWGQKATISTAGGNTGGKKAAAELARFLTFTGMDVMEQEEANIVLSPESFRTDWLDKTPGVQEALCRQAEAFIRFLET